MKTSVQRHKEGQLELTQPGRRGWNRGSSSAIVGEHLALVGTPLQGGPPDAAARWCFESGAAGSYSGFRGLVLNAVRWSVVAALSGARTLTDAAAEIGRGLRPWGQNGGDRDSGHLGGCNHQPEGDTENDSVFH